MIVQFKKNKIWNKIIMEKYEKNLRNRLQIAYWQTFYKYDIQKHNCPMFLDIQWSYSSSPILALQKEYLFLKLAHIFTKYLNVCRMYFSISSKYWLV